jgi:hypothetical protein
MTPGSGQTDFFSIFSAVENVSNFETVYIELEWILDKTKGNRDLESHKVKMVKWLFQTDYLEKSWAL